MSKAATVQPGQQHHDVFEVQHAEPPPHLQKLDGLQCGVNLIKEGKDGIAPRFVSG